MTPPLAALVALVLAASAQAQPAPTVPLDPVPVPTAEDGALGATILDREALRELGYWSTQPARTTVETEAAGVVSQTFHIYIESRRLDVALDLGVGAEPAAPDSAQRVQVGDYDGRTWLTRGDYDQEVRALLVPVAPRRWLSAESRGAASAELAEAVAELVDLDALAAVPESGRAWQSPRTSVAYATTAAYWAVHPGTVWARQVDPADLVAALPPPPPGYARTVRLGTADATPRFYLARDGGAVERDLVVPLASAEACYTASSGPAVGPPPAEAAALALAGLGGGPEPGVAPAACLRLAALHPDADPVLAQAQRRALASEYGPQQEDFVALAVLGLDAYEPFEDVHGRPGQRSRETDRSGEVVVERVRLGPRRVATLRLRADSDLDGAALWAALDADVEAAGVAVPYAVRPTAPDGWGREGTVEHFDVALAYAYGPAEGLVAHRGGRAEIRHDGLALEVPVPDGWEVWRRRTLYGEPLALAASERAPLDPDEPTGAFSETSAGLALYVGAADGSPYSSYPLVPRPLAALAGFDGPGTSVFRAVFRRDRCRAEPVALAGALAALALACESPGLQALLDGDTADYTDLVQSLRFGPQAYVVRAIVLEHAAGGAAGVLVVGPGGAGSAAEALARSTADGMVARRVAAPDESRR